MCGKEKKRRGRSKASPLTPFFFFQDDASLYPEVPDSSDSFHYDLCAVIEQAIFAVLENGGFFFFKDEFLIFFQIRTLDNHSPSLLPFLSPSLPPSLPPSFPP